MGTRNVPLAQARAFGGDVLREQRNHQASHRMLKKVVRQGAGESKPKAYPLGDVEDFDDSRTLPGKRRVSARRGGAGEKSYFFSTLLSPAHRQHNPKSRLAAQHAVVSGSGLFERICLDHGTNTGQRTVVECVF